MLDKKTEIKLLEFWLNDLKKVSEIPKELESKVTEDDVAQIFNTSIKGDPLVAMRNRLEKLQNSVAEEEFRKALIEKSSVHSPTNITNIVGNKFGGDAAIGPEAKIIKPTINLTDNSVKYTGNKVDIKVIKGLSILVNKYGEKKMTFASLSLLLAGLIGIIADIKSIVGVPEIFSWLPSIIPIPYAYHLFGLSVAAFVSGMILFSLIQYKYDSQCPKCKKHYAIEEEKNPEIREVKTHSGEIVRNIDRFYKCKFCGHSESKSYTETIEPNT